MFREVPGESPGNLQIPWKNRIRGFPRIWPGVNGIFSGLPRETPGTSEGPAGASPARLGAYSNPSDLCPRPAGDGVGKSGCGKRQVRSSVEDQGRPIPRTMPGGSRGFPRECTGNRPGNCPGKSQERNPATSEPGSSRDFLGSPGDSRHRLKRMAPPGRAQRAFCSRPPRVCPRPAEDVVGRLRGLWSRGNTK